MRIEEDVPEPGAPPWPTLPAVTAAQNPAALPTAPSRAWTIGINSFAVRVLNYLTNHVINRVPSYRLRPGSSVTSAPNPPWPSST